MRQSLHQYITGKTEDYYDVTDYVKLSAEATVLTKTARKEISGLTKESTRIQILGSNKSYCSK